MKTMTRFLVRTLLLLGWLPFGTAGSAAAAGCTQWDLTGNWQVRQVNGFTVLFDLIQNRSGEIRGSGGFIEGLKGGTWDVGRNGSVTGSITGNSFSFVVTWPHTRGQYDGKINADGTFGGITRDLSHPKSLEAFYQAGERRAACTPSTSTPPSSASNPGPKPLKILGKYRKVATAKNDVDIHNGPGGQFKVIGMLKGGSKGAVTGQQEGWYKLQVTVPGGSGWVAEDHLTVKSEHPFKK
jgi:hypothetical protein